MFAVAAIEAVTGHRVKVPRYSSEWSAAAVLQSMGGIDAALQSAGGAEVSLPLAQRGDVVQVDQPGSIFGGALAVCVGAAALAPGGLGLVSVPRDRWIKAWRL